MSSNSGVHRMSAPAQHLRTCRNSMRVRGSDHCSLIPDTLSDANISDIARPGTGGTSD
jgi:hypothetical protein